MLHQPIPGSPDDALAQAILGLLTHDHPTLWSLSELNRSLTPSGEPAPGTEPARHLTEDAVERLYAAGLLHRMGEFVFASRAAHESQRLVS